MFFLSLDSGWVSIVMVLFNIYVTFAMRILGCFALFLASFLLYKKKSAFIFEQGNFSSCFDAQIIV